MVKLHFMDCIGIKMNELILYIKTFSLDLNNMFSSDLKEICKFDFKTELLKVFLGPMGIMPMALKGEVSPWWYLS